MCYNRGMTEHELQNAILDYLKAIRCYPMRINSGKLQNALTGSWVQLAPPGTPDCITSLPDGSWGCIEVKSKTGTLSSDQITTLRNIASKGLKWLVADDIDDLVKWLANPEYHGKERHIKALNTRFAYSEVPKSKKFTSGMWLDMELHAMGIDKGKDIC